MTSGYKYRGLGGEILGKTIEHVYEDFGERSIVFGCHKDNCKAARFYERHGFSKTGVFEGDDEYFLRLK